MKKNYTDENIVHVINNEIEYLQFKILNKYNLKHCITLRHGGVSKGDFESLNFNMRADLKENVMDNLYKVCSCLNIDKNNVFKAHQNHTDNILVLDSNNKESYHIEDILDEDYDAYIVTKKNIATLITTADCNPVIVYDPIKNIVANIHSGWKGTIKKIVIKTCEKLINEFGCNASDLIVCIGPSIKKCCFSSEEESFKKIFTDVWKNEEDYMFYEDNLKRFHIDLVYLIKKDLEKLGVKNIIDSNICTVCNSNDFFSYRSATKNKQKNYGLMATIVSL